MPLGCFKMIVQAILPLFFRKRQVTNCEFFFFVVDILGFFGEIFLMKVLVFQNFDQKVPKTEQKTVVCYNFYLE